MNVPDREAPPPTSPPEDSPGYADTNPRDRKDTGYPNPRAPNPDEGGMERDPGTPDAADG